MKYGSILKGAVITVGTLFGSWTYAECTRDMPTLTDNALGATTSIHADKGRSVDDFSAAVANYLVFGGGRAYVLSNLHPWGFSALFPGANAPTITDLHLTAVCNEVGQCGQVTFWGELVVDGDVTVSTDVGDGLATLSSDLPVGLSIVNYVVEVNYNGDLQQKKYSTAVTDAKRNLARSDPNYDPRFPMPTVVQNGGFVDSTCRNNDGVPTAGGSESYDADYSYEDYYDYWEMWMSQEEAWGGRVPQCVGDFSDPNVTGVVCSSGD